MAGVLEYLFPSKIKAKQDLEDKRKKGLAVTGAEIDRVHQDALRSLMSQDQLGRTDTTDAPLQQENRRRKKMLGGK